MTKMRQHLHHAFEGEGPYGREVESGLYCVIIIAAVVLSLATIPTLSNANREFLATFELILLIAFATEYALRVYAAPKRRAYILSPWGVIDLLACLPLLAIVAPQFASLRTLRLLRLLRVLKLLRLGPAADRLIRAFRNVSNELAVFALVSALAVFLAAVGIYLFEHKAQPDAFASIPQSLWWAVATLTTVGYGDVYPITVGGRVFTAVILVIGLGVVAVPAGVVTAALLNETDSGDKDGQKN